MNINFKNLEVRIKNNFCTLVDFNKSDYMYIQMFIPFYKSLELEKLITTCNEEDVFYKEVDKLVIKSHSKILQLQNYKGNEYPQGLFLYHTLNAHPSLVQELQS